MKKFNTTAVCIPNKHYMVDISDKVKAIRSLVDDGKYFTINRARQYGKTTTLNILKDDISDKYNVLSLSFEGISNAGYATEGDFIQAVSRKILDKIEFSSLDIPLRIIDRFEDLCNSDCEKLRLDELQRTFQRWIVISERPMVLIIDEVDSASNNQVFIDFLAQLRDGYISRDTENIPAFHSVILAGVTDIKHLKGRIRDNENQRTNSPWNIAADFNIDMSLSEIGIQGMLRDYENDHNTGMDIEFMARELRAYTNGYPFLVSRLCQLLDESVSDMFETKSNVWTRDGLDEAVKIILSEKNTLFDSLTSKIENMTELKQSLRGILMCGERVSYNSDSVNISKLEMYGFVKNQNNTVMVANRIFETRLYNYFLSDEELKNSSVYKAGDISKSQFIKDGKLNMPLILERFIITYTEIFGSLKDKFKEKDGREQFLLYIKPIINGIGNYYIESQTRDQTRTDLIIDYLGQQYIIELKIWRGERYNVEGERQICEYLDYFNLDEGYMLSFNFNKKKEVGVKKIKIENKILFEATL